MDNPQGAVDVPLSLYGGLNLELAPSDLPEGISPDCQDVIFLPGSVSSRPGTHRIFPNGSGGFPFAGNNINYLKTFVTTDEDSLNLYLDSSGNLFVEDVGNSPGTLTGIGQGGFGSYAISASTPFGREYIAFSDGQHGINPPIQYDGTNVDPVSQYGPGTPCSAADTVTGVVTAGVHQFVVLFQTRTGFITAPSPYGTWTAGGSKQVAITNLPIGPPNVVARIVAFTGAGGANFFYIPVTPTVSGSAVGTSTVVNDNTSTTATFNFSDSTLFNSTAIDITGNNLFQMLALGPSLGTFCYSERTMFWGMDNEVTNFLNMDFAGGYIGSTAAPTGWTVATSGGAVISAAGANQQFPAQWQITGTGGTDGQITQGAFQDQNGVAILQPNTQYTVKLIAAEPTPPAGATFVVDVYSAGGGGVLATASFAPGTFSTGLTAATQNLSVVTPAVIPSDTVLRVYTTGATSGRKSNIARVSLIYTNDPYINNRAIMSYVGAPSQLDQLTGFIGPADDPSPIMCCSILRDTMRIKTTGGMHNTQDNGTTEPSGWTVSSFSRTVGAVSIRGGDPGRFGSGDTAEDWDLTAAYGGMYIDFGGDLYKVSQEVQSVWDNINKAAINTLWIKNDVVTRRVYIGIPRGTATTPNVLLVWDYRELDAAIQIASAAPIHISFTGKMISSDLTRKWTVWNLPMSSGEIMNRPNNVRTMCFGTGNATPTGPRPNVYYLDSTKLTDDDFGQIFPYYTTYAFLNHEAEVALGTGVHRKLYRYLTLFASGVGALSITPLVDNTSNSWGNTPAFTLQSNPTYDIEWGLNVLGERCFFRIAVTPISGTDNSFTLNKMVVSIQQEPWAPVRGAW